MPPRSRVCVVCGRVGDRPPTCSQRCAAEWERRQALSPAEVELLRVVAHHPGRRRAVIVPLLARGVPREVVRAALGE